MTSAKKGSQLSATARELLLSVEPKELRLAVLESGRLEDLFIERTRSRQLTGNIYRGRVTNILHNIQSAFIDIGEGENGFIHISDIVENSRKFEELFEMDFERKAPAPAATQDIRQCLRLDQPVLVQVVKEPIGSKGARLTSNISLAGRYLVLLPNTDHRGVSRKIEDRATRERLKKLIRSFEMPHDMGLICRTASQDAPPEALIAEAHKLLEEWSLIQSSFNKSTKPTLLFQESDFLRRAVLMAIDRKVDHLLCDDSTTCQKLKKLAAPYLGEHPLVIECYREKSSLFERYGVDREIERALRRKVWLPSGGYLFFDRTEAMTTIDVNSGRSLSGPSEGDLDVEESLLRINLEAAEELSRQLRIRNLGGLIVCDFIDMRSRRNQRRLLERLKDFMKEDGAKCTILGMSEFGLIEMTRQRHRESLEQMVMSSCPYCLGSGLVKSNETTLIEIERSLKRLLSQQHERLKLVVHPEVDRYIQHIDRTHMRKMAEKSKSSLEFSTNDQLHLNEFQFYNLSNGKKLEV